MTALHRMGRPAPIQPRYQTRPYRMHPGRREHIYGRIKPADPERGNDPTAPWLIGLAAVVAIYFIGRHFV